MISILMVVKDGERFLPLALESIRQQDYSQVEIIVVDGQSRDRTAEIVRAVKGVRYIIQTDDGLANARNRALRAARGDLIAFLDSDDIWVPGKLQLQVDYLASHPNCLGTVTRLRFVMDPLYYALAREKDKQHYGQVRAGYTPSSLLARRELFQQVGEFDPSFELSCDADWFARVFDMGLNLAVLPKILITKRIHDANLSLDVTKSKNEMMRVLKNSMLRKHAATGYVSNSGMSGYAPTDDSR